MGHNLQINYNTFQDMLIYFSGLVHEKKAEKMPYQMWRKLTSIPEGEFMNIFVDDTYMELSIYGEDTEFPWVFRTGDNSFGDFLYENLLKHYKVSEPITDSGNALSIGYDGVYVKSTTDWTCADAKMAAISTSIDTKADVAAISASIDTQAALAALKSVEDEINSLAAGITAAPPMKNCVPNFNNNSTKNKKENNTMKFNFDFGPVNSSMVRMSVYGLAVKNKAGTWVSFDAASGNIVDVDVFNFDGAKFLYKMPVAVKDVAVGDVVIHNSAPMFVLAVGMKTLTVVDVVNGERKDIMLTKSPFMFDFVTKVVNFLGNAFNADASNPFGNMWMLMAMSGENKDMNDILPFLMLNNATPGIDNNVLMFMALSNTKDGSKDMLPWLLMMNTQNSTIATPAHTCTCGGHCTDNHTQG